MDDDDHVEAGSQRKTPIKNQVTKLPLEPVANCGSLDASSSPKPHARDPLAVWQRPDGELGTFCPSPPSIHGLERVGAFEADGAGRFAVS